MRKIIVLAFAACVYWGCGKNNATPPPKVVTKPPDTTVTKPDTSGPQPVVKTNTIKVYAHYMPWFETPATSPDGKWGQHWTMANENPDIIGADGRRQIASYFYPMTGPYASSDRDIIDYQLLLMKYSGID